MIKVDLITGFLGSGKTTCLKKYAKYFMDQGMRIGILENDYGAVNVDMLLLNELRGENCELEMVAGGCDADCHRRRFKTKLISMGMVGYDRILIEPSGIFDMDEFFDVLQEEPLNQWYEIGNVIAIVDAGLEEDLSLQSDYFLASQVAHAGKIILSKTQEVTREDMLCTMEHLNESLKQVQCQRTFSSSEILEKNWDELSDSDWQSIKSCGYRLESYVKLPVNENNDYTTLYYMNIRMEEQKLPDFLSKLMNDPVCGNIVRIKGFMPTDQDQWIEVNAARKKIEIRPIPTGQEIFIVIGEHLNQDAIDGYWHYNI